MKSIRIGTRKSPLALWQAEFVADQYQKQGLETQIIPITSEGDNNLTQPIYELGITGVFTRSLDIALLNKTIDVAVHSLKDVPTVLPKGISLIACLERENPADILIYKNEMVFEQENRTIATGSLRRAAFWKNKYPNHTIVDLRGNVQLRLEKLLKNDWDAAIFAYAGLHRSNLLKELTNIGLQYKPLDWMIPAPAQGIIGVTANENITLPSIANPLATISATVERQFLNILQGGCTAPIGACVTLVGDEYNFKGAVLSLDGTEKIQVEKTFSITDFEQVGKQFAQKCIDQGADNLIKIIKSQLEP